MTTDGASKSVLTEAIQHRALYDHRICLDVYGQALAPLSPAELLELSELPDDEFGERCLRFNLFVEIEQRLDDTTIAVPRHRLNELTTEQLRRLLGLRRECAFHKACDQLVGHGYHPI